MPRLGGRRLDVPLARARRPRLRRLRSSTSTMASAARSRTRTPATAASSWARRSSAKCQGLGGPRSRSARSSGTRSRRARAAGDRPHRVGPGRDRPLPHRLVGDDEGDQAAPRGRSGPAAAPIWREETEAYCHEHGLPFRSTRRTATPSGAHPGGDPAAAPRLHPAADRNLLALAAGEPRLPRALEKTLAELLASTAGHEAGTSAAGFAPCASTTRCASRGRRFGPWRLESDAPGSSCDTPARRSARGTAQESAGSLRGRQGAARRARRVAARRLG